MEQDPQFIWEVKKDWYGLDFAYVSAHPESLFWSVFVDARYQHEYLDFFPDGAIGEKLAYIQEFYQRTDEDVEAKLRLKDNLYFSKVEMDQFIDDAVDDLYDNGLVPGEDFMGFEAGSFAMFYDQGREIDLGVDWLEGYVKDHGVLVYYTG